MKVDIIWLTNATEAAHITLQLSSLTFSCFCYNGLFLLEWVSELRYIFSGI